MGRRLRHQRRGRGSSPTYRHPASRLKAKVEYRNSEGRVVDIVNDPSRTAPLARIEYGDGSEGYTIAPRGLRTGESTGFVSKLSELPVGTHIFGIENSPNSGPKLCRTSGTFATVMSRSGKKVVVEMPSKKTVKLDRNCRASTGVPAGEGHKEKPWIKAGKKWIAMHRKGIMYPRTSGVAMNAVDHPFGGPTKPGKSTTCSRNSPTGRKVGSIGARRTGKKK